MREWLRFPHDPRWSDGLTYVPLAADYYMFKILPNDWDFSYYSGLVISAPPRVAENVVKNRLVEKVIV